MDPQVCRSRIARTLRIVDVPSVTQHVECVALLDKTP
jgi:hypothetical protein